MDYPILTRPFTLVSRYGLFDQVAMDTIGPLPESAHGHKYILVIIDTFSRLVELIPIHDLTAKNAAAAVIEYIGRYGIPASFLTDNGTQFVNDTITQLMNWISCEHVTIHPYSHQENGIVERANKEVMRHLRNILFDTRIKEDWPIYLPLVQRIQNSMVHSSIGISPIQLVYGNALDLDRGVITPYTQPPEDLNQWVASRINAQRTALAVALEKQQATDLKRITTASRNTAKAGNEPEYPINSYVLVDPETGPANKLSPQRTGPYRVVDVIRRGALPSLYVCQDLITHKEYEFLVNRLRPFNHDPLRTDPTQVAMRDTDSYEVERIVTHRFTRKATKQRPNVQSELEFLTKWVGYPESDNTWQSWKDSRRLRLVHEYLRTHRDERGSLARFIPPEFK